MIIESIERFRNGTRIIDIENKKKKSIYYLSQCPHCKVGTRLEF